MIHTSSQKKNVLFITVDDLRPELGCYQERHTSSAIHPNIHTPNIDKLASKSLLLKRAYVQQALCSPSRVSFLTSRRPDTTHVYDLKAYFRKVGGKFKTIPEYFKNNGYTSIGLGKIFHSGSASGFTNDERSWSWTFPYFQPENKKFWTSTKHQPSHLAVPYTVHKRKKLPDTEITKHALKILRAISNKAKFRRKPFFLAVGFLKPHLPFIIPKKFLKYYPKAEIRLPGTEYAPVQMPSIAWANYGELRKYKNLREKEFSGDINTTLPVSLVKDLRRHYYAAVTYIDALVGVILKVSNFMFLVFAVLS